MLLNNCVLWFNFESRDNFFKNNEILSKVYHLFFFSI